jgi:hypothetical protein
MLLRYKFPVADDERLLNARKAYTKGTMHVTKNASL